MSYGFQDSRQKCRNKWHRYSVKYDDLTRFRFSAYDYVWMSVKTLRMDYFGKIDASGMIRSLVDVAARIKRQKKDNERFCVRCLDVAVILFLIDAINYLS